MAKKYYDHHAKQAEMRHKMHAAHHTSAAKDGMVEFYAGYDSMHNQEIADGGIIHEDHSAMANLPQQFMVKPYPQVQGNLDGYLDDSIHGIDETIKENTPHGTSFKPKKY
jgi:hypothetical protein